MPRFAIWMKGEGNDAVDVAVERATIATLESDLGTESRDSGGSVFEGVELLAECTPATPLQKLMECVKPSDGLEGTERVDADAAMLEDEHVEWQCTTPKHTSTPERERHTEELQQTFRVEEAPKVETDTTEPPSQPAPTPSLWEKSSIDPSADNAPSTRSAPVPPTALNMPPKRSSSFSLRHSSTTTAPSTPQHQKAPALRLYRPTELNLGSVTLNDSKPQSELEKQFHLMRNSKTQSKAALRSPTQLLQQRLSAPSGTEKRESKVYAFVPPQPSRNGCLMPGPAGQMASFASTSVRARTQGGRPAWWCKNDKLVVFDGIEVQADGTEKVLTRTSKGLGIARRRGDTETIIVPMTCAHCQDMLHRTEWKQEVQVCRRSICWDCNERCKWEVEQENKGLTENDDIVANRDRADSVLQDGGFKEEDMLLKVGIEQWRPKSPIEAVGSIEERLRG